MATTFGPPPPQVARLSGGAAGPVETDPAPDCLTLNVWSPDLSGHLPVMVWIYGGAYLVGSADQPVYDASNLAHEGVVVVTLNYRVGVEGFASLDGAPENRGLLDQVAALAWVQENIAALGGDPGGVTVFGQSAGAGSIAALLAMPSARGLFRRAVLQSVPATYFSARLGRDAALRIGAELGLSPTVADFSTRTPAQLAEAAAQFQAKMPRLVGTWGKVARTITPFSPVVDGETLPSDPWNAVATGSSKEVVVIAGFMRDEYRVFHSLDGTLERADDGEADSMVRAARARCAGTGKRPRRAVRVPGRIPGEVAGRADRGHLLRLALPHGDAPAHRTSRRRRRAGVPLRGLSSGSCPRWSFRRLPRVRRPAHLRELRPPRRRLLGAAPR
jgi:para-nitrobenzyl esterase